MSDKELLPACIVKFIISINRINVIASLSEILEDVFSFGMEPVPQRPYINGRLSVLVGCSNRDTRNLKTFQPDNIVHIIFFN